MASSQTGSIRVLQTSLQIQERRFSSSGPIPIKVEGWRTPVETTAGVRLFRWLSSLHFHIHLCLITILVIFLTVRRPRAASEERHFQPAQWYPLSFTWTGISGLPAAPQERHFRPACWYPPLLTSTGVSGLVALSWQGFTGCYPSKAFMAAFQFTPLLSLAVGVIFVVFRSAGGLAVGVIFIFTSFILSTYVCSVSPRFNYAIRLLSMTTAFPPKNTAIIVIPSILMGIVYVAFLVSGIGGAIDARLGLKALFIAPILLSLVWTLQVIKNIVLVTISRIKYMKFACGVDMNTRAAFCDTIRYLIGTISIGSAITPFFGFIRGLARAITLVAGESDEFLFPSANCYSGVASTSIRHGNRWGFVHVGVCNKGFVKASDDTWGAFKRMGLESLIDSDLTGSFCFFCGVSGGAICSITSGVWALFFIHKSYATELALYAFLIGYFMCRIGMAWPQACVSAYYVAYADNRGQAQFDSTIPDRRRELQRLQAQSTLQLGTHVTKQIETSSSSFNFRSLA